MTPAAAEAILGSPVNGDNEVTHDTARRGEEPRPEGPLLTPAFQQGHTTPPPTIAARPGDRFGT